MQNRKVFISKAEDIFFNLNYEMAKIYHIITKFDKNYFIDSHF